MANAFKTRQLLWKAIKKGGNSKLIAGHVGFDVPVPLQKESIVKLLESLSELCGRKVLVLGGGGVDSDCFGAAYTISKILGEEAAVALSGNTNPVKKIAVKLEEMNPEFVREHIQIFKQCDPSLWDHLVILDTADRSLLGGIEKWEGKIGLVLDHHKKNPKSEINAPNKIIEDHMPSTCSILAFALPDRLITNDIAFSLAAGLIVDSAYMRRGGDSSHLVFAYLSRRSLIAPFEISLLSFGEHDLKIKKRLLSALDAHPSENGGLISATRYFTMKGDYRDIGAMLAEYLTGGALVISNPADLALCVMLLKDEKGDGNDSLRITLRSSTKVSGIDLNIIAKALTGFFGGDGWGHVRASGGWVRLDTDPEVIEVVYNIMIQRALAGNLPTNSDEAVKELKECVASVIKSTSTIPVQSTLFY